MDEQVTTDARKRAAEVLREYADLIAESETNRSGPLKGKMEAAPQSEVDEYRKLAAALDADAWIPVTERLPDDDLTVMIALDGDEPVWLGWHDDSGWYSADATPMRQRVTHWKPMPEGPNG